MSVELPRDFGAAAVACGIKREALRLDLALIASNRPAAAAGVFTQNRIAAAPVQLSRSRVPAEGVRAIVANSGNANACTGEAGRANALRMTQLVAQHLECPVEAVLVCSTGIIGQPLPMEPIERGIVEAAQNLAADSMSLERAARGIMTTDTVPKMAGREARLDGHVIRVAGIAKGAAMIGPNMATMLSFVLTDAALPAADLQRLLGGAVDQSFNMISVEGHTSTNDTVLALANAAAGGPVLSGDALNVFARVLDEVCTELAQSIVRDAEGARHFVTIEVEGMRNAAEARRVAKAVADSALVKTAIYGADPNWGRFVSAAGYCGVEFEEKDVSLWLDGQLLYERGMPVRFDAAAASQRMRRESVVHLKLQFHLGTGRCQFWTCDLTEEYIKLNADYHT